MADLTTEDKLAMVVRAQVAVVRAAQARHQLLRLHARSAPLLEVVERFQLVYGRAPNLDDPEDQKLVISALRVQGAEGTPLQAAADLERALSAAVSASEEALAATSALRDASEHAETALLADWVRMPAEQVEQAVEEALRAL